ncbi:hypothetical protein EWM64_g8282 [Hericium alpestre]|uniref:Uncharacterized protein n=1 Tax=Hericium alpestre TaxID=135208 RepID=A0A4Y9ZPI2_9AGAM|nr:hypothetical protein EWM64_g8282 [Hericium alpestre]
MARTIPRFGHRCRSRAQKQHTAETRLLGTAARRSGPQSNKENISEVPGTAENKDKARITYLERELHNMTRRFRRAAKTIAWMKAQNRKLSQSLKEIMKALPPSGSREADLPGQSLPEDVEKIKKLLLSNAKFRRQVDALRKQVQRKQARISSKVDQAVQSAKVSTAMVYYIKRKGTVTSDTRRLIRALVELGVPFGSVLHVIRRVLLTANVPTSGSFSDRTVHRAIIEGGVAAKIQIADEIKQTQSLTISGDGTSLRNVHFESAFLTYTVPPADGSGDHFPSDPSAITNEPQLRAMPVLMAPNHTSQEQLNGWKYRFVDMADTYNRSPVGIDNPLSLDEILDKIKGMISDHANDQKHLATLFEKWKLEVDREIRGRRAVMSMSEAEQLKFCLYAMELNLAEVGGCVNWEALSEAEKKHRSEEAYRQAIHELGEHHFASLTPEDQRWSNLFLWAGCGMHKEMNSVKWGARSMEHFWSSSQAQELGAVAPIPLFNKENAAVIADETASTSKTRAEQQTSRGGVKTTALAGAIFRNKYEKKGQQDNFRWFFASVLGYMVQFPDTSNTRFGSHCDAASELLVHLEIFIDFLNLIRDAKDKGLFTHMELNVYNALHDPSTLSELAALSLYSQTISHPYMGFVRGSASRNAMDLGLYHQAVIAHCEKIVANPDLLLDSGSPSETTLDGSNWERPEAVYAIRRLYQDGKLPFLKELLTAFFKGAVIGWGRFTTEFAPGGRIDQATPREREAAFVRPTNDHNEGRLGKWVTAKRKAPSLSLDVWNAKTMHKDNHTDEWLARNNTPALDQFLTREARLQDSAGATRAQHARHVQEQQERVTRNKERRRKTNANKVARAEKLSAYTPNLDPAYWTAVRRDGDIKEMLSWLRAPSRKHIVQVPTGLTKPGVGKEGRLLALVQLLQRLTDDQKATLSVSGDVIQHPQTAEPPEDLAISEGEESLVTDEEA